MPDVKFTRGGSNGNDNTPLTNGQILFDREAGRIMLDAVVNNVLTRITVKEGIFDGTTEQWNALSDAQKACFKYVNLTDDYSGGGGGTGTVTQVKVGETPYNPTNGVVSLPAYPTVNNATLTIQKNGTNVQTFTANQNSNATANISVPTKVSDVINDVGYTTNEGTVTGVKVGSTSYSPTNGVVELPAYPTVNNATLTIQKNGTAVQTFTANQGTNATANIIVPTKVSELTNDSGFVTSSGVVTGVKGNSESNYKTGNVNISAADIGLGNVGNYKAVSTVANQGLSAAEQANARTNIGAMLKPTYLTQTLVAGSTTVTFTNSVITNGALISVYTSVANLNYTSMTVDAGSVTIVYPAQSANITVTLEIKNV